MTRSHRYLVPLAIFLIVAAVYLADGLAFIEDELIDARYRLGPRSASGEVVLVAVDAEAAGRQPWRRSEHAQVVERLLEMGARQVVLNLDLSMPSDAIEDAALAATLAELGEDVVLPVAGRQQASRDGVAYRDHVEPLRQFRGTASLALATLRPDADGLVRRLSTIESWHGTVVPTLAGAMVPDPESQPREFYVDFGIAPGSIPRIPYAALTAGTVPAEAVAGRHVILGPTTGLFAGRIPVPAWRSLPATTVHAVAADALIQGRALQRPSAVATLLVTAVILLSLWLFARRARPLVFAATCLATIAASHTVSIATYIVWPVLLDVSPWGLAAVLTLAAGLVGNVRNQRDRLFAQAAALRRSSRFLSLVVNSIKEAMITTDLAGRIRTANTAAARMFGWSTSELAGRDVVELFVLPDSSGAQGAQLIRDLISGYAGGERTARRADGSTFPIEVSAREVASGSADAFVLVARDLSERQAAEQQRGQLERMLIDAIESFGEPFALFDANERLAVCNTAFRELHGYARHATEPGTPFEALLRAVVDNDLLVLPQEEKAMWVTRRLACFRNPDPGVSRTVELSDGRWLRVIDRRTSDGGIMIVMIDVTVAKRREIELTQAKEEAELANHAKSEFLWNMSHELRTPLNAVMGFSEMITREMLGPIDNGAYREYGRMINESAAHLLAVIGDILDMSRIETDSLALHESDVDLHEVVRATLQRFTARAHERRVRLVEDLPAPLPRLRADARIVKQILTNLVSNGVKFSGAGDTVAIAARACADGGLDVTVSDTGVGIPPERIEHVLAPFGQVEDAMTRSHQGVGLGLPLARRFAEAHGARFEVTSAPGRGTSVTVGFPRERVDAYREAGE